MSAFQERLGYGFRDVELLREALTHSSYAHESGLFSWNERLEFLGDAVLELSASARIYRERPDLSEGDLTRIRAKLVCGEALFMWAKAMGVNELLRVNSGLRKDGKAGKLSSVYSDAAEAVFGAVYLDGGFDKADKAVNGYLDFHLAGALPGEKNLTFLSDPKSDLQVLLQERGMILPEYRTISKKGPSHNPVFTVELIIDGRPFGKSRGKSIKEAEFKIAAKALTELQSLSS